MITQIEIVPKDMSNEIDTYRHDHLKDNEDNSPSTITRVIASLKEFATVSEMLRIFGAIIMVASMSMFMLQGWSDGNDVQRYLKLLTQTGLLACGGFLMSYLLKENKGARLFFGLALVSIPANFTILGALIFSVIQLDSSLISYPGFASWKLIDTGSLILVTAGALLALTGVALLSFKIMARQSGKMLAISFLALNSLLLLPSRGSLATGILIAIATFSAACIIKKLYKKDSTLATFEGKFSLSLLLVPALLIMIRSLFLYEVDVILELMLTACGYMVLRQSSLLMKSSPLPRLSLEILSVPVAYAFVTSVFNLAYNLVGHDFITAISIFMLAALMFDFSLRTSHKVVMKLGNLVTALIIVTMVIINLLSFDTALGAIIGVTTGTGLVFFGLRSQMRSVVFIGIATAITSAYFGLHEIFEMLMTSGWLGFAILGASAIVIASVLERHGATLKLKYSNWNKTMVNKQSTIK